MNKYSTEFIQLLSPIIGAEDSAQFDRQLVDVYLEEDNLVLVFRQPDITNQDGYHHWEVRYVVNEDQKDKLIHTAGVLEF